MPFIHTRVNRTITPEAEKELAAQYGKAVAALGKSEQWLMLQFEGNCRLYFQGTSDRPLAFVSVNLYGKASSAAYQRMTEKITAIVSDTLAIPADGIYVEYEETDHWGWQGANF